MTIIEIILLTYVILFFGVIIFLIVYIINKKKQSNTNNNNNQTIEDEKTNKILEVLKRIEDSAEKSAREDIKNSSKFDTKLTDMEKYYKDLTNKSTSIIERITDIKQHTTTIPEAAKQISSIAKLYDNSKNRGNIGEKQLETIINNVFGENKNIVKYQAQVEGGIIDCKIEDGEKNIYIDSKFNKDNWEKSIEDVNARKEFKKDVKTMIDDLTKYNHEVIMFIPSERIYLDINDWFPDIIEYASKNKVIIVSPTTIWYVIKIVFDNIKNKNIDKELLKIKDIYSKFINERFITWMKDYNEFIRGWEIETGKIKKLANTSRYIIDDARKIETKENKKIIDDIKNQISETTRTLSGEKIKDEEDYE